MSKPLHELRALVIKACVYVLGFKHLPPSIAKLIVELAGKVLSIDADNADPITFEGPAHVTAVIGLIMVAVLGIMVALKAENKIPTQPDKPKPQPPHPPQAAEFLLYLFLNRNDREAMVGCLEEDFVTRLVPKWGYKAARFLYWVEAIRSIPPVFWMWLRRIAAIGTISEAVRRFFKWL